MANIILSRLTIDNFKGCRHFELAPNRKGCTISGENAAGKTTIFDAYMWLLWGKDSRGRKDFDIKPLLPDGTVADHAAITSVEGEFWADDCPITLKRTYYERWSTKRGRSEATFDGHSSDYFIDDVPTQKNGFDQAVADLVGSEDTFRILTSVTWFPEQMKWQNRRAKLFDLAGIQDDRDIMATDAKFAPLLEAMGGKELEDYKKIVAAKRKNLSRAKSDIPARIDEQRTTIRQLDTIDFAAIEAEVSELSAQEEDLKRQLQEIQNTDAAGSFQAEREKVLADLRTLEAENRSYRISLQSGQDGRLFLERSIQDAETAKTVQQTELGRLMAEEERIKGLIDAMRARWSLRASQGYEGSDACPTCGQKLPERHLKRAKAAFEAEKAKDLKEIESQGQTLGAELERIQGRIISQQDSLDALEDRLKERQAELDNTPVPAPVTDMPDYAAKKSGLEAEVARLDKLIQQAKEPSAQAVTHLEEDISAIQTRRRQQEGILAQRTVLLNAQARVAELQEQARTAALELAELDGALDLIEEFSRYKAGFVEDSINGMFDHATFRLFREQINGGLEECCDVVYEGVPFQSLNNGARINVGIDIIKTFGEKTGTSVPLFVDNAEAVTDLWTTGGQMILLKVDGKKKELTVK